jgi:hypothetical protein
MNSTRMTLSKNERKNGFSKKDRRGAYIGVSDQQELRATSRKGVDDHEESVHEGGANEANV